MFRTSLVALLLIAVSGSDMLFGQVKAVNRDKYKIHITQTGKPITVDGILDEEPWQTAEVTQKFQRVTPTDTGFAKARTEVRLTYDKSNLYVGVICWDPTPGKRPVESLRRDYNFMKNDNFMLFLNTYNDLTNGFAFGISAAGAQTEGLQYDATKVLYTWDIKWRSAVKSFDDRWVTEFAIPFRSIRYIGGDTTWGVNFGRLDLKNNEKSAWAPMPRQFPHCSLPYVGTLIWDKPMDKAGLRFSIIPYVIGKVTKGYQAGENVKWSWDAGLDAKMILSTSLNLDLTVNPDYSQVEVDKQQTNLDRYELFFPEKRQFYLENSDLFANLGTDNIRPFFSRRIGLDNPVLAGARLSGNLGNRWRIALMDIQTGNKDEIRAANYVVAALQRLVFSRSSITAFVINKQVLHTKNDDTFTGNPYNRVAGLEYNLSSPDNRWNGKAYYHQNILESTSFRDAAFAANLTYSSQYLTATINQSLTGSGYNSETGYIRRKGYYEINPVVAYKFFPKNSKIVSHGPGIKIDAYFDPYSSYSLMDMENQLSYSIEWMNKNTFSVDAKEYYVKLFEPFDPTNTGGIKLAAGEAFDWYDFGLTFGSDPRRMFNATLTGRYGGYYNGNRLSLNSELNYRVQPFGSLALSTTYNDIRLPAPYNSAKLLLIGPKFDFTFTDKIFFTSYIQYNNQIDNLNINLRFQWRFAPVSDLFIVYTENSFYPDYTIKNRGLVVKLSYWFN
ncbi:MAG: DUF5916 domain-containing protein [Bacteroidota bacterium]|nr:DUF5916 domain-containing protein [Bacteroidota bacterium]